MTPANLSNWTAAKLAEPFPTFHVTATCGEAYDWLLSHPAQPAAAIVDDEGLVHGLVTRLIFLARYAQRYYPELYNRHSILKLANVHPPVFDENVAVVDLGASLVTENPGALLECFVVTAHGRYAGIGTCETLMRAKVELLQAHERDLARALENAVEANSAKSNFLALMSHELRTPLNAIIGFSEVLNGELFGPLGVPRYREYAGDIHGAGKHLLALINDILDLSKAEAGKLELHPEPVNLIHLMAECIRLLSERSRQLAVGIEPSGSLPDLFVDRLRVKQILLNLLSNAVKFTPPGGQVRLKAGRREDGAILLTVEDTGIGMAPEMIPIALEPFRQIDSPLSRNFEGTGLGLSLVKSLAEAHGAAISIDSSPNRGTRVSVCFPPSRVVTPEAAQVG